jgi:hypothetical protein
VAAANASLETAKQNLRDKGGNPDEVLPRALLGSRNVAPPAAARTMTEQQVDDMDSSAAARVVARWRAANKSAPGSAPDLPAGVSPHSDLALLIVQEALRDQLKQRSAPAAAAARSRPASSPSGVRLRGIFDWVEDAAHAVGDAVGGAAGTVVDTFKDGFGGFKDAVTTAANAVKEVTRVADAAVSAAEAVASAAETAANTVANVTVVAAKGALDAANTAVGAVRATAETAYNTTVSAAKEATRGAAQVARGAARGLSGAATAAAAAVKSVATQAASAVCDGLAAAATALKAAAYAAYALGKKIASAIISFLLSGGLFTFDITSLSLSGRVSEPKDGVLGRVRIGFAVGFNFVFTKITKSFDVDVTLNVRDLGNFIATVFQELWRRIVHLIGSILPI